MKTIKKDECSYSVSNAIRTLAMVRLKGFEPPTYWFVASHSIQLSYSRISDRQGQNSRRLNYLTTEWSIKQA